MLAFSKKSPEHVAALERVREWVRGRFQLGGETAILVAEVTDDDLPPRWLKPALAVPDDFACDCC